MNSQSGTAPAIARLADVQRRLLAWHDEHQLEAPWRHSRDPYHALVAAVMAQQTQMSRVLPAYERFIAAFPTIESLAAASLADVIRAWRGMGYNQRAVRLHRAACQVAAAGWPADAAGLEQIDGIGPFTAAIVASFAFGERAACVDTNVRRVLGRLAGDATVDGKPLQALADASIPQHAAAEWNQALMDYGARVCTTRPKCDNCVVSSLCRSYARRAQLLVADARERYDARQPRRNTSAVPFEQTDRYYRGRIIDALCEVSPGETLPLRALPALLADGSPVPDDARLATLLRGLERAGLIQLSQDRISLPE